MDDTPVKVDPNSPSIPAILDLVQRTFEYMDNRINPPSSMHKLTESVIQEQATTGEIWTLGNPVCASIFLKQKGDALYIGKLAVDKVRRGEGLARQLVDLASNRATALGLAQLELETRVELTENHATFRRMGFVITGEGTHPGFEKPTFVIMQKRI